MNWIKGWALALGLTLSGLLPQVGLAQSADSTAADSTAADSTVAAAPEESAMEEAASGKQQITEADYANRSVEMADVMRDNGKIYVVVAILAIILAGIIVYLVNTERRVRAMEREMRD